MFSNVLRDMCQIVWAADVHLDRDYDLHIHYKVSISSCIFNIHKLAFPALQYWVGLQLFHNKHSGEQLNKISESNVAPVWFFALDSIPFQYSYRDNFHLRFWDLPGRGLWIITDVCAVDAGSASEDITLALSPENSRLRQMDPSSIIVWNITARVNNIHIPMVSYQPQTRGSVHDRII